jgi:sortase (surface protein transpeptidase)
MKNRRPHIPLLGVIVLLSAVVFATATARALLSPPEDIEVSVPRGEYEEPAAQSNWPARLVIPALDIDATVQRTGITARGNMAVPTNYDDVGWYRYGPPPGALGSAVIAGHVDNGAGFPAVFSELHHVRPGDTVAILTAEGETIRFVVERVEHFSVEEMPTGEIFAHTDSARLNLITCAGSWDPEREMYTQRLVVYAVQVA